MPLIKILRLKGDYPHGIDVTLPVVALLSAGTLQTFWSDGFDVDFRSISQTLISNPSLKEYSCFDSISALENRTRLLEILEDQNMTLERVGFCDRYGEVRGCPIALKLEYMAALNRLGRARACCDPLASCNDLVRALTDVTRNKNKVYNKDDEDDFDPYAQSPALIPTALHFGLLRVAPNVWSNRP